MPVTGTALKAFRFQRAAEDILSEKLEANRFYPFHVYKDKALEFSVRYTSLYFSIAGSVVSVIMLIFWITGNLLSNAFFILPVIMMVISLAGIWNFKDTRVYTLLPDLKEEVRSGRD
ncbi:hypothetical protein HK101_009092 [Irineochytrium annulatum]|nr:hypothetical protein HK101_009092 [Irineochytrium annulatum]